MSHDLSEQLSHARWQPVLPPPRGEDRRAFHVSILVPGLSNAFHRTVLRRGYTAVRGYRAEAEAAAGQDPVLRRDAYAFAASITPADGMLMATMRGDCQFQFWSRIAIVEYRKLGHTIPAIAKAFRCSPRTVTNVIRTSVFFSPDRKLTRFQLDPPSKIPRKNSKLG